MRDFFAQQYMARRNTFWLILYFTAAVAVIVALVTVFLYVLTTFNLGRLYVSLTPFNLSPRQWNLAIMGKIAGVVLALILVGTGYKYLRLRSGGGSLIAQLLGGRVIYPDTRDFYERRLLNIIEEMAIASGVTVPTVYLLDREGGINAFAAGFSREDAVLGVTRGAVQYLTREELQGVIAHEFSHILNGDMLINVRLQGILHGILVIGLLGEILLKSGFASDQGRDRGKGGGFYAVLVGLVLLVVGYTGVFVARLIKSAVARQREFLADASAVQFTRNPLGLAGALKKIGGLAAGSKIRDPHASEISHMFFGNGLQESWFNVFSTHPPLLSRIQKLDPEFKGDFPARVEFAPVSEEEAMMYAASAGQPGSLPGEIPAGGEGRHVFIHSLAAGRPLREVIVGPHGDHLRLAREMIVSLPPPIRDAARNGFGARAMVFGLLLDGDPAIRAKQLGLLERETDPEVRQELARLLPDFAELFPEMRLPLVDMAMPALKSLSPDQYAAFKRGVDQLMGADGRIDLFEYALRHVLLRHLEPRFHPHPPSLALSRPLAQMGDEISCVLSLLSRLGHGDENLARKSLMQAVRVFGKEMKRFSYRPARECSLKGFDNALKILAQGGIETRQLVLAAALDCITYDEKITIREAELFRAIAEALSCPVPLWLTGHSDEGAPEA
ncbi:M48 family metallopeptidase [Thiovibrio frasassiensis]|uniref:M48 family metallopeptidase n=1 Tax=Thiovibrio frasassiensis TaxID=2984131 RepID=A0A9X4MGL4_9BACT|nr:M48 family metallopeptidase [Thiovibrio frasassiensis]MDG4475540.1 M48 family metallopeptidase [Thiovibrio frasassiensis]